jgi:DNA-binding NtrC family response regulator
MSKILIVDHSTPDADLLRGLLAGAGAEVEVCLGSEAAWRFIHDCNDEYTAAFVLWDVRELAFAEMLALLRRRWPEAAVIVMFEDLTAELATRASSMGARDVLEKPVDAERIRVSLRELLSGPGADPPLLARLGEKIHGRSPSLLSAMRRLARVIPHADSEVLLLGESGTGKELFARAIHELGPHADEAWVDVQVSAIPDNLFESQMFGHEKGIFTDAKERRVGYFEQAGGGTLFLDEIGDLAPSLQGKLLRVIQERSFRRLGGKEKIQFGARLVCATNIDLAEAVRRRDFRQDLFERIKKETIRVPPLRERTGDVELLALHFLNSFGGGGQAKPAGFARETLKILQSYHFPGNVRELENMVKSALISCQDGFVRPQHLPLENMREMLPGAARAQTLTGEGPQHPPSELWNELKRLLPENWLKLTYREASKPHIQAFDRVYLRRMLDLHRGNITRASAAADLDHKTFRKRWKDAGLPPLNEDDN